MLGVHHGLMNLPSTRYPTKPNRLAAGMQTLAAVLGTTFVALVAMVVVFPVAG